MATNKQLLKNSALAFVLAGLIATTLHELAHFATALLLEGQGLFHPTYVLQADNATKNQQMLVAAAGPLFSLVSGLAVIGLCRQKLDNFWSLVRMWFGFLSAQIGFGYFLVAPFAKGGDTGQVLELLNANTIITILVCAFGAIGTYLLLPKLFSKANSIYIASKKDFFQLGMYPWLIGTSALVLIYFVIENTLVGNSNVDIFSVIGTATIGIFTPLADYTASKQKIQKLALGSPVSGLVVTVILILILSLLSRGIAIGSGSI
jgi:hypothetical protein